MANAPLRNAASEPGDRNEESRIEQTLFKYMQFIN